ncbi:CYTH domain-containing protein [Oscillatoria sp. CS-180]|uniref:CYTH domain-containing protein n=1 Tax=Oscillatoria sp. CS-180 TaxID=3021720 RepID=UPI00232C8A0C|nr:CYTH domain-containing protein [Oscillatoria sp. CS-180]MDB9528052.1 CYTH domain-containing protein [Oscillatoria sp. CS-180]
MAQEIERKFLVKDTSWREHAKGLLYRQGYIPTQNKTTVRVRVVGDRGYLTVKSPSLELTRQEFEYDIPVEDAEAMLNSLCSAPLIEKRRHTLRVGEHLWEIDEFLGDNTGLVLAEIELTRETEEFVMPTWVGEEVSANPNYFNSNLVKKPYRLWEDVHSSS